MFLKNLNKKGDAQIRTGDKGFAGPCLTTWLHRRNRQVD
jgi:hypothetical protein